MLRNREAQVQAQLVRMKYQMSSSPLIYVGTCRTTSSDICSVRTTTVATDDRPFDGGAAVAARGVGSGVSLGGGGGTVREHPTTVKRRQGAALETVAPLTIPKAASPLRPAVPPGKSLGLGGGGGAGAAGGKTKGALRKKNAAGGYASASSAAASAPALRALNAALWQEAEACRVEAAGAEKQGL